MRKILKAILYFFLLILLAIGTLVVWYLLDAKISEPAINQSAIKLEDRTIVDTNHYVVGKNWLKKNQYGLWEMYLEGSPFEIGLANGMLTKELIYLQESAFVEQIKTMIPSETYLDFLKYFIKFFNRDIEEYIIPEYRHEIYGVSKSASNEFNFIGTNYERMLNYHAAHDIGHALQDLMLVGCTSFAANLGMNDSTLIIGRNFDFYINDAFAENKIVCFVKPESGYEFAYVTWASMIGVVSGMNEKGLTVTINAGKSGIPLKSATPISLLAREILQYAADINDAINIAEKRDTFVSESLLIGSALDNRAVIIEKSPDKMDVYESHNNYMVCSNHFQSEAFANDKKNKDQILNSASSYRQNRARELLESTDTVNSITAALVLRDRKGLNGKSIGIGNEKALAQMISHHSVVFQPQKQILWISTSPYQLGKYLGYKIQEVFENQQNPVGINVFDATLTIPADPFLFSNEYAAFKTYRKEKQKLSKAIENNSELSADFFRKFISRNPDYFLGYVLAGDYYMAKNDRKKAKQFYEFSLKKEFENSAQRKSVLEKIDELSGS